MNLRLITAILVCCALSSFAQEMTLEEKVGQLLIVHFNGEEANDDAKTLIEEIHVGGIIYYNWANGLHSPEQVLKLSAGLQQLSKIPLFIAVDQEGGRVTRLKNGFTIFPSNKAVALTGDPLLAREYALIAGQELRSVGVNFNLAPVVDVNSNPRNPVIGDRSFGNEPNTVIAFAKNAIDGYQKAGIASSLKHFPGHGDVEIDSHLDLPLVHKSKQELENCELLPFATLAKNADTIMTAHIMIPSIDPKNCATLSKNILNILREEIGFDGVIISDSLVMEGLLKNCDSIDDAAIRAINAGCDLLILGGKQLIDGHKTNELTVKDISRIHRTIVNAVNNGIVSEKRLNSAITRILKLKNKYNVATKI